MWKSLIVKVQDCLWFPTIYGKNKSPSVSTISVMYISYCCDVGKPYHVGRFNGDLG